MRYKKISGFSDEIGEDTDTQFRVLNKLNIGFFEPRGIDGKNIADLSDEEVSALKKKMSARGIRASSVGSPVGKIKLEEDFEPHFRKFKRVVEIAKKLETRYIRIFSFYHSPAQVTGTSGSETENVWTSREREEVLERLSRMIAYARDENVVLLHENEKDIYGDTVRRCEDLMRELGCRHFRAVFDPANFVQCGQDTREAYGRLRDFISYVHVKDALMEGGKVVPAGAGDGHVEYILKSLLGDGFDGFISLEPHLGSFAGLEALELGDKVQGLPAGGEGTFTLAYRALESILDRAV